MRPGPRVVVPLKSMCSSMCERPAPSHLPSSMLPALHHACAESTGALWSSRMISVNPFSKVVRRVPGGRKGISGSRAEFEDAFGSAFIRQSLLPSPAGGLGFFLRRGFGSRLRPTGRKKWLRERLAKVVRAFEIFAAVLLGLVEQALIHHVEDHLAEIFAAVHAPVIQKCF